jgi:hypothetical protein
MTLEVPSIEPGSNTLPAELRVRHRGPGFAHDRLMKGQRADAVPEWAPAYGYRAQLSGLGQWDEDPGISQVPLSEIDLSSIAPGVDPTALSIAAGLPGFQLPNYSGPTVLAPTSPTPPAPNGYQWATLLSSTGQSLARILAISQGGSAISLPGGQQLIFGSPQSAAYGAGAYGAGQVAGGIGQALGGGTGMVLVLGGLVALMLFAGGSR